MEPRFASTFQLDAAQAGLHRGQLPALTPVRQSFPRTAEPDVRAAVRRELAPFLAGVGAGQRIAVTGGSRGIARIDEVTGEAVQALRDAGAEPFIVPAMGSHGGATPEGQRQVLAALGISEAAMGCPVRASMAVERLGTTSHGFPVYFDRLALEADGVLVINRAKVHTIMAGPVESGLCKMLVIGLGKRDGADRIHKQALRVPLAELVAEASRIILASPRVRLLGGLALVENAYKGIARVQGVPLDDHERLVERESALLEESRRLMARLPFRDIDVLVVEEIGKNISGTGMDNTVLGRKEGLREPVIGAIYVRGLSPETHGNAHGIGMADVMPRRLLGELDLHAMYMNAFTSRRVVNSKLPLLAENDLQALQVCMGYRAEEDPEAVRLVWIRNTGRLEALYVSPALLDEVERHPMLEVAGEPFPLTFDETDTLRTPWR